MFVEKSELGAWAEADKAALKFMRDILGREEIPEELIELPWEEGGFDTMLPNSQRLAVEKWMEKNIKEVDGVRIMVEDKKTLFSRI